MHKHTLLKLDPDTRAFTLVGAFMGYFALLEEGIGSALGEVLDVKGARRIVITRNMNFDDKIKTLRSLVNFYVVDKDLATTFNELAKRARKCGETRNIVAHTPFRPSTSSDGVQFFPVSATSKIEMPNMDWSIDDFLKHIDDINQIDNELRKLESRMPLQRIAEALIQAKPEQNPFSGLLTLGAKLLNDPD